MPLGLQLHHFRKTEKGILICNALEMLILNIFSSLRLMLERCIFEIHFFLVSIWARACLVKIKHNFKNAVISEMIKKRRMPLQCINSKQNYIKNFKIFCYILYYAMFILIWYIFSSIVVPLSQLYLFMYNLLICIWLFVYLAVSLYSVAWVLL